MDFEMHKNYDKQRRKTITAVAPNLFGIRDQLCGRQFSHRPGGRTHNVDPAHELFLSPATHLQLCSPVLDRPWTSSGPWPRGWGLLHYNIIMDLLLYNLQYIKNSGMGLLPIYSSIHVSKFKMLILRKLASVKNSVIF